MSINNILANNLGQPILTNFDAPIFYDDKQAILTIFYDGDYHYVSCEVYG